MKRQQPKPVLARLPVRTAILAPLVASLFEELRVGATFHVAKTERTFEEWFVIRYEPGVIGLEILHRRDSDRWRYAGRSQAYVHREKKTLLGEHAGFHDLWVPVGRIGDAFVTLVVGPFAIRTPTSADVLARFRAITGSQGRLGDSEFAHYLSLTLSTLTLEGSVLGDFKRLMECFAALSSEGAEPERLSREIEALRPKVLEARYPERMWNEVRASLDDRTATLNNESLGQLGRLGLKRPPEHVIVGLFREARDPVDPVQAVIDRHSFQRAAVALARKRGGALSGRIGDYGISLLVDDAGSGARQRARLVDLCERMAGLAKRYGLKLHSGVALRDDGRPWQEYQRALAAAERALAQGIAWVHAERATSAPSTSLSALRRDLERAVTEAPKTLPTRFESYIDAAQVHCGFVVDVARAHLEAGYDQVCDAFAEVGTRDEKAFRELRAAVQRDAANANTLAEVVTAFRRGVADIARMLEDPSSAHQEQSMRRAVAYIRDHIGEPLSIQKVAKVAGFAPRHFTDLFLESVGETFTKFVLNLRLERAKAILSATDFSAERVGELSGFGSRVHFHRTFKANLGMTPQRYRERRNT